jgi:hypothetical protein
MYVFRMFVCPYVRILSFWTSRLKPTSRLLLRYFESYIDYLSKSRIDVRTFSTFENPFHTRPKTSPSATIPPVPRCSAPVNWNRVCVRHRAVMIAAISQGWSRPSHVASPQTYPSNGRGHNRYCMTSGVGGTPVLRSLPPNNKVS